MSNILKMRQHYHVEFDPGGTSSEDPENMDTYRRRVHRSDPDANCVSSELAYVGRGYHLPVLDFDFECHLEPSSTPGHYHFYVDDRSCSWDAYADLLKALHKCGLIEWGYLQASLERKATFVRMPGVRKGEGGE